MIQKILVSVLIGVILIVACIAAIAPILRSYPPGSWQSTAVKFIAVTTATLATTFASRWAINHLKKK